MAASVLKVMCSAVVLAVTLTACGGAGPEVKTQALAVPLEGVTEARVELAPRIEHLTINRAPDDFDQLFAAEAQYIGDLAFDAGGGDSPTISLSEPTPSLTNLGSTLRWDVMISRGVPVALLADIGSGGATFHLNDLQLTELDVTSSSGGTSIFLPVTEWALPVRWDGGSGEMRLTIPAGANVELHSLSLGSGAYTLDFAGDARFNGSFVGGAGAINIDISEGIATRLEVLEIGSGGIEVPGWLTRITGDELDNFGVWQTADYADASDQINLIFESTGSGRVAVRWRR